MTRSEITYIDQIELTHKTILLRVDFNVSINPNNMTIADDARIRQALPTIKYLLERGNKIIIASHLGRPKGVPEAKYSMRIVCPQLHEYLPDYEIKLINDFLTEPKETFENQKDSEIMMLENTRFYPGEKTNDPEFAKKMASLADIFVNDAFGVSHRSDASVVGVAKLLPSYGGLLMKKEIEMISKGINNPERPLLSIIGGAKLETKLFVIEKLLDLSDFVFIGGALANTLLHANGVNVGASFAEKEYETKAKEIIEKGKEKLILLSDCLVGDPKELEKGGIACKINEVPQDKQILDIGPETQARLGTQIAKAKTIIWNGPIGYFENIHYRHGTDFLYYAITQNTEAVSIIGGGDTLAAISKKEYLEKITHISTGGGAMLEFIENGTLPGIEALKGRG